MDQETSGVDPVCLFVFKMNSDSVVFCSYLSLLKDNVCCEYCCVHGPSVVPMYVFVSGAVVVTVAFYSMHFVLQLFLGGIVLYFGNCMPFWIVCFLFVSESVCCMFSVQL